MSECAHVAELPRPEPVPLGETCPECLEAGSHPVQLRLCLTCGHVGCCDSSPLRHATGHFRATGHPVMRSFEAGELALVLRGRFDRLTPGYVNAALVLRNWTPQTPSHCAYAWAYHE